MDPDFLLIAGIVLAAFTVPAVVSSISEGSPPRMSIIVAFLAITMIAAAMYIKPGGYRMEEIPDIFFGLLGRMLT